MSFLLSRLGRSLRTLVLSPSTTRPLASSTTTSTSVTVLSNRFASSSSGSKPGKNPFPQFVNLPPYPAIAGQGNAFATAVVRKRTVADPNLPSFDSIGELKWCGWRMLRDCRRRHLFTRYHPAHAAYRNVRKCRMLPNSIKEAAHEAERALPRDSMIQMMHQRCAISSRSRGLLKRFRLSRLVWRHLADYNQLSGVIKACWR